MRKNIFVFAILLVINGYYTASSGSYNKKIYQVAYEWTFINFTWPSREEYKEAVSSKKYIPANNVFSAAKFYKNNVYLALPRNKNGSPVTLGTFAASEKDKKDILIKPFPSWEMNVKKNCSTFQNVQSLEIDSNGIMWVIDGLRGYNQTLCPQKLVLLDLNKKGKILNSFEFPFAISPFTSGRLNDIVVDETGGGYAYITDDSNQDPGIIVYSKEKDKAWKLRDSTMFANRDTANFSVNGTKIKGLHAVNGIALGPQGDVSDVRMLYYSALTSLKIHAISNEILKNEEYCKTPEWRNEVKVVANKTDHSDGYGMDNKGNLYFGLLSGNGIASWNIYKPFTSAKILTQNKDDIVWPGSFSFDNSGNMYITVGHIPFSDSQLFTRKKNRLPPSNTNTHSKFKILKIHTGTDSYLYFGEVD